MACPKCECKTTYHYDPKGLGDFIIDSGQERCANCGHIFDIENDIDDDEVDLIDYLNSGGDVILSEDNPPARHCGD